MPVWTLLSGHMHTRKEKGLASSTLVSVASVVNEYLNKGYSIYIKKIKADNVDLQRWWKAKPSCFLHRHQLCPHIPPSVLVNGLLDTISKCWVTRIWQWLSCASLGQSSMHAGGTTCHLNIYNIYRTTKKINPPIWLCLTSKNPILFSFFLKNNISKILNTAD